MPQWEQVIAFKDLQLEGGIIGREFVGVADQRRRLYPKFGWKDREKKGGDNSFFNNSLVIFPLSSHAN